MKRQKCEEEMMQEMEPETDKKFIEKKKQEGEKIPCQRRSSNKRI